jgi:hypothetical protein
VVQRGPGYLAILRLDPAPLEAEPIRGQPGAGEQVEILAPAVVVVDSVAARLDERGVRGVFPLPVVAVDVVALDLVARGGGAQRNRSGKLASVTGTSMRVQDISCAGSAIERHVGSRAPVPDGMLLTRAYRRLAPSVGAEDLGKTQFDLQMVPT